MRFMLDLPDALYSELVKWWHANRAEVKMEAVAYSPASSVLRPWVMQLPLREQATLLAAIRGCDTAGKDHRVKSLTAAIRYAVLIPDREDEVNDGTEARANSYMRLWVDPDLRVSDFDALPFHFVTHLVHACAVLAYRAPEKAERPRAMCRAEWLRLYEYLCHGLHLNPETEEQLTIRLASRRVK